MGKMRKMEKGISLKKKKVVKWERGRREKEEEMNTKVKWERGKKEEKVGKEQVDRGRSGKGTSGKRKKWERKK